MSPIEEIVNPIGVEIDDSDRLLRIRWDDGHLGVWSWPSLRKACPCALCAGEAGMPGLVKLDTVFTPRQTTLTKVKWIGRYALAPIWEDGHDTGLYTYRKLRDSCECDEHRAA